MSTINIDRREVSKTNRNGRINSSITNSTSSTSSTGTSIDWAEITQDLVTINRDLAITGSVTASKDIVAYFATETTSTVLDALSVSLPLLKIGTNIELKYNPLQFDTTGNILNYIGTGGGATDWSLITNKPTFATVATTGNYNDLINKPDNVNSLFTLSGDTIYSNSNLNLHINGNITASKEVMSYFADNLTTDILSNLSVSQPLQKTGSNISLNYSNTFFDKDEVGQLIIKPDVVATKAHTHKEIDITDLHKHLNKSIIDLITEDKYNNWTDAYNKTLPISISGDTLTINKNLNVNGNITASQDVIAYFTDNVTNNVLDNLLVNYPLAKSSNTISLNYNTTQFELVDNLLSIKSSILNSGGTNTGTYLSLSGGTISGNLSVTGNLDVTGTHNLKISGASDISNYFNSSKKALYAVNADYAANAGSASYANNAGNADYADYATNSSSSAFSNGVFWANVYSKPTFATVATTGNYNDLTNKPTTTGINRIIDASDFSTYFNANNKALNAVSADSVSWANITSKPSTFAPSSHTVASHSDSGNYYNTSSSSIGTQVFQIKNSSGSVIWNVTTDGTNLLFSNGSNRCKIDASGNLLASGEITAYASI